MNAYLDGLLIEREAGLLVDEEILDLETVVALELDHLAHTLGLGVTDDGAIAGCPERLASGLLIIAEMSGHTEFLLDDLENLLVVELGGYTLDRSQGLASITLCGIFVSPQLFSGFAVRVDGHATAGYLKNVRWMRIWMYSWV